MSAPTDPSGDAGHRAGPGPAERVAGARGALPAQPRRGRRRARRRRARRACRTAEAARRLQEIGPNKLTSEKPPSIWAVALAQLRDPMNIMLIAVARRQPAHRAGLDGACSSRRSCCSTSCSGPGRSSRPGPASTRWRSCRCRRPGCCGRGSCELVPAEEVVPGDIVRLEAGDIVPADGRIVSLGDAGDPGGGPDRGERPDQQGRRRCWPAPTSALGDRTNMLFQNTSVTRGTATMVVTATGMQTEMGQIATMLTSVDPHPVAAAEGARRADQGARHRRLDGGGAHRRRRAGPRPAGRGRAAARHRDGDLGDPDRPADVRAGDAVLRRPAAGRRQGRGEEPHRRRDPRRHERDQHRQDRHADAEPDDGLDALHRRRLVHRRRRGLRARPAPILSVAGHAGARLHPARLRAGARQRRHRQRRRRGHRRPDRGGAGGAGRQARRRRRADPAGLPAAGRGAVRLRVQVHGDVPPASTSTASSTSSSWSRAAPTSSSPGARMAGGPLSGAPGRRSSRSAPDRGGQPADGGEGPARAGLRRPGRSPTTSCR